MRKNLFTLALLFAAFVIHAQDTTGLIGHWNMNGNTNDVSGSGNNGIGNNLTPAAGQDGVMGHAWYFNGHSSSINVPYNPDMNLSAFTISATIEVMGYYARTCHANELLCRGNSGGVGNGTYQFLFSDAPAGYGCSSSTVDSAQETFSAAATATGATLSPINGYAAFDYLPYVAKNVWCNVTVTFDDTMYKIYINGVLADTASIGTPGLPMGSSTDGLSIGDCQHDSAAGYPYFFHGNMDDMRLYNRVLSDSEIAHINDTCGKITEQPVTSNISSSGGTALYSVGSSIGGAIYQWQGNSGSGFVNLVNAGPYSGVTTTTLTVTGSVAEANNLYRCLVSNTWGCADTSASASLTVGLGVNNITNSNFVSVYPNPATTAITIQSTTEPVSDILITNVVGQTVYSKQSAIGGLQVVTDVSAFPAGVYFVKVNGNTVRKFVKE